MTQHIAFIGLGNMGGPMALNLCKAGYRLSVFDVMPDAVKKLTDAGATAAADIPAAVKDADIVITMLPGNEHVKKVYLDAEGVLAHAKAGALLIDSSTINADIARDVAKVAAQKGFRMIDAPVSGGTAGAAAGTLTFIVGGAAADLESARPALEKMGKNIFHAGASGAGQLAKICNNMLLAIHMIGTCEALALAEKAGLDPQKFYEISSKSTGYNWSLNDYTPAPGIGAASPADNDYQGGFASALMLKDLRLAMAGAQESGATVPLGEHATKIYEAFVEAGNGSKDFGAIFTTL